jgi:hypothetical protein
MLNKIGLEEYKDIPYTLVGNTSLPTSFHIALTGKGVKEIAKKMSDDDTLDITITEKGHSFELIKR